jgi:hypothetical protein
VPRRRDARASQEAAELRRRRAQAQLDRSERRAEPLGDLPLGQALEVGEANHVVVLGREHRERRGDAEGVAAPILLLVERGRRRRLQLEEGGLEGPSGALAGAQSIDGAVARHRHDPGGGAPPPRIEVAGFPPQLDEGLLHDVLRVTRVAQHAHRERQRARRVLVEQRLQGAEIASRDA